MFVLQQLNKLKLLTRIKHQRKYLKVTLGTLKMAKKLAVFDFDHTIINDNSDVVAVNMIDPKNIPTELKQLHRSDGWTAFMQGVFNLLHKHNIKEDTIKSEIESLREVKGMSELIKELKNLNFDVIIISDANSYFINAWLKCKQLEKFVLKVYTNPAYFNETGLLILNMYHLQNTCKLSTKNLCKGQIMEDFIKEQNQQNVNYEKILYCGDGINDFCPILRLSKNDLACVRKDYKCVDLVKKAKDGLYVDDTGEHRTVNCGVCVWSSGGDILNYIKHSKF